MFLLVVGGMQQDAALVLLIDADQLVLWQLSGAYSALRRLMEKPGRGLVPSLL